MAFRNIYDGKFCKKRQHRGRKTKQGAGDTETSHNLEKHFKIDYISSAHFYLFVVDNAFTISSFHIQEGTNCIEHFWAWSQLRPVSSIRGDSQLWLLQYSRDTLSTTKYFFICFGLVGERILREGYLLIFFFLFCFHCQLKNIILLHAVSDPPSNPYKF